MQSVSRAYPLSQTPLNQDVIAGRDFQCGRADSACSEGAHLPVGAAAAAAAGAAAPG